MRKILLTIIFICLFLVGCSNTITSKEAEQIAIQAAIDEGYSNPKLFTEYDSKTKERYHYSKNDDKDIEVWEVSLITDERSHENGGMPDLIYYIDSKNGEIINKISGVE